MLRSITSSPTWKKFSKEEGVEVEDEAEDDSKSPDASLLEKSEGAEKVATEADESASKAEKLSAEKEAKEATLADITELENDIISSLGGGIQTALQKEKEAKEKMEKARTEVAELLLRLKEVDVVYRIAKREVDEWNLRLSKKKTSVDVRLQDVKQKAADCRTAWRQYEEMGEKLKTVPLSQDELQKWQELCADCLGASKRYSTLWEELLEIKRSLRE